MVLSLWRNLHVLALILIPRLLLLILIRLILLCDLVLWLLLLRVPLLEPQLKDRRKRSLAGTFATMSATRAICFAAAVVLPTCTRQIGTHHRFASRALRPLPMPTLDALPIESESTVLTQRSDDSAAVGHNPWACLARTSATIAGVRAICVATVFFPASARLVGTHQRFAWRALRPLPMPALDTLPIGSESAVLTQRKVVVAAVGQ